MQEVSKILTNEMIKTEADFRRNFSNAAYYVKSQDPNGVTFFVDITPVSGTRLVVKKPWGVGGAIVDVECNPVTHVLLVDTGFGETYPVKRDLTTGLPVGYMQAYHPMLPPCDGIVAVTSEPILAALAAESVTLMTFEGETSANIGDIICWSKSKGLFSVRAAAWASRGYDRLSD